MVPEVLAAVKRTVDRDPTPGQFILAGRVQASVDQDMWAGTGRLVHLKMFGLTERELAEDFDPGAGSFLERLATGGLAAIAEPSHPPSIDDNVEAAVRGGFPHPTYHLARQRSRQPWFSSYLEDPVTRDASLMNRHDPEKLRRYLEVLALNNAGLPDDKSLYDVAGINAKTAAGYDSLLQRLYITDSVPAWAQTGNRLTALAKRAKRYVVDSGLAAAVCGISAADIIHDSNLLGRTFDAFGTAQPRAENALSDPPRRLNHLRAGQTREIDLVVDMGERRAVGLEFKAAAAVTKQDTKHLDLRRADMGERFLAGAVLYAGSKVVELDDRIYAIPLSSIWS